MDLLGITGITVLPLILYADSSIGGTSGYEAGGSESPSLGIEPGEEKRQFGHIIEGMSYSEVQANRAQIYSSIVNKMQTDRVCYVSDVLATGYPNTHKLIREGYRLSGQSFDPSHILATRTLDGKSLHLSPAALKIMDMR